MSLVFRKPYQTTISYPTSPGPTTTPAPTGGTKITEIAPGVYWGSEVQGYFSGERFVFMFGIGSSKLSATQLEILKNHVIPAMAGSDPWCEFYGTTDRSGSSSFNLQLSEKRLWEFQAAVMQAGGPMNMTFGNQHKFFGEAFAEEVLKETDGSYDPYERAVTAYFWPDSQSAERIFQEKKLLIYGRTHEQP